MRDFIFLEKMTGLEMSFHWGYIVAMGLSALGFVALAGVWKNVPRHFFVIHLAIVVWSGLMYLRMNFGDGVLEINGDLLYLGRYADWIVSTPLMLLALALTGLRATTKSFSILFGLLGSQFLVILLGFFADLAGMGVAWRTRLVLSCVFLVVNYRILWGPLDRVERQSGIKTDRTYRHLASFITIQFALYPIVRVLGQPGFGILSAELTTLFFVILPFVSKSGFGFFDLYVLSRQK